ncbi:hypothetical protein FAI41_00610 [Acetobacteraceae bacterium]|nr:hypothetical protein FAI41_00610 [Acetobacteraceae bacterium]
MKKYFFLSLFAAGACFQIPVATAQNVQNDWQNITEKTPSGDLCGLETKGLPFTFSLYQGQGLFLLRLTDPSWGMGGDMSPQVTLKIGDYQNSFLFKSHHLTTIESIIPALEMAKIEAALGNAKTASFSFNGLEPNIFSLEKIGDKVSAFQNCALGLSKGTVSMLNGNAALS